ncbi:hypothetical protein U1Q18_049654, partial [Sarracenia purpurea var. burkii]
DIIKNVVEPSSSSDHAAPTHVNARYVPFSPSSTAPSSSVASTEIISFLHSIHASQQAFQTDIR